MATKKTTITAGGTYIEMAHVGRAIVLKTFRGLFEVEYNLRRFSDGDWYVHAEVTKEDDEEGLLWLAEMFCNKVDYCKESQGQLSPTHYIATELVKQLFQYNLNESERNTCLSLVNGMTSYLDSVGINNSMR